MLFMRIHNGKQIVYDAKLSGAFYFQAPEAFVRSSRSEREPAEIVVILSGAYRATTRDSGPSRMIDAGPGDVVFWPSGQKRVEENPGGNPNRCISLYFDWRHSPEAQHCVQDQGLLMLRLAERIVELHQERHHDTQSAQNAILNALLAQYVESAAFREPSLVMEVAHYIDEHTDRQTRLQDIADHVGLELHHLCRRYMQLTGRTVMDDVRRRKIEHARHLLLTEPNKTLAQLARRTGIGDEHQLSRLFKKHTGMNVREWKRLAKSQRTPPPGKA